MTGQLILVVEDDDVQRRQIARALKAEGYRVLMASSGDEALGILRELEVDLVLTDKKMPGMDGGTLLKYMRANYPQIPVAIVTAYPEGVEDLKPDALLVKPYSANRLLELVQRLSQKQSV